MIIINLNTTCPLFLVFISSGGLYICIYPKMVYFYLSVLIQKIIRYIHSKRKTLMLESCMLYSFMERTFVSSSSYQKMAKTFKICIIIDLLLKLSKRGSILV